MNSLAHEIVAWPRLARWRAVVGAALILLALTATEPATLSGQSAARVWVISPAESRLTVNVLPAGVLSSALHTHHFRPADWSGEVSWDPDRPDLVRVDARIAADSLRDHQPELSDKDIAKVEGQVRGPDILDTAKFPRIVFEGRQLEAPRLPSGGNGEFRATLVGTLTLHGKSRPLAFPIQGRASHDKLEADATVSFRQSDFGIKPYKTALGAIAVRDEVTVEILLVALPHKPE